MAEAIRSVGPDVGRRHAEAGAPEAHGGADAAPQAAADEITFDEAPAGAGDEEAVPVEEETPLIATALPSSWLLNGSELVSLAFSTHRAPSRRNT